MVAAAMGIGAMLAAASASAETNNHLWFADGSYLKTFGPNSVIRIDGTLEIDQLCLDVDEGTRDFMYPATDVYIVPAGSAREVGDELEDVSSEGTPNTIVAVFGHAFLDEVIAATMPGGYLEAGVYDVVFDTCQDGEVHDNDTVFQDAITVILPEELPPVDLSIVWLKLAARVEHEAWLYVHKHVEKMFDAADLAAVTTARPRVLASINKYVQDRVLDLVMNVAKNRKAIWQDPPDPSFQTLTMLTPVEHDLLDSAGALPDAFAALLEPLAFEAALGEALLHALERYQGAQAAGNAEWALIHARQVRDVSAALRHHLLDTTAITDLRSTIAAQAANINADYAEAATFIDRIRTTGFDTDERRMLRNRGYTASGIAALEASIVARGWTPPLGAAKILAALDDVLAARADMVVALQATIEGWGALAGTLAARSSTPQKAPLAKAGGPYDAIAGRQVILDASTSTPPEDSEIISFLWDLDGDGEFDDATGQSPTVSFDAPGSRVIGVLVRNSLDRTAVSYAQVTVTGGDRPPVLSSASPANDIDLMVGQGVTLAVVAADPDGDALAYAWTLDGQPAGTASSFLYAPGAAAVGEHIVTVIVTGGNHPRGTTRSWRVVVTRPDADGDGWTATPDCDDARAEVHPGAIERFGNDIDDDCDASTPDAPPGGLTGRVWTWGGSSPAYYPTPIAEAALDPVVHITTQAATYFAVLADGQVRGWGVGHSGVLGTGDTSHRDIPVSPLGIGGEGTLAGITRITVDNNTAIARRVDGTVVAWGDNRRRAVGDGTTVDFRLTPVQVMNADGTPLTGVRDVSGGGGHSLALMENGTVRSWGLGLCRNDSTVPNAVAAVSAPAFGNQVVQLEANLYHVFTRNADGSVWSCGADATKLGRGPQLDSSQATIPGQMVGFGPGSGVIDVTAGGEGGLALKSDGSVWSWGYNQGTLDVLGIARNGVVHEPRQVPLPPGPPVIDVEMDDSSTALALRADGTVLVWGYDTFGSSGLGNVNVPVNGIQQLPLDGFVVALSNSVWNGSTIVRPRNDTSWVDRPAQWIDAWVDDTSFNEDTDGSFVVTLSHPAPSDITVTWALVGQMSGTAIVRAGSTTVSIPVAVTRDTLDEEDEEILLQILSISHGVRIERSTAIGTIVDDDAPPPLGISPVTVIEGGTSLLDVQMAIRLSEPSGKDVEVSYATADGTATWPGDYGAAAGVVHIPAGETEAIVHLAVHGDAVAEHHETFTITLSNASNAVLVAPSATVTILDDEPIRLDVVSPIVTEDDVTTQASFQVAITVPPPGVTVTVPWSIAPGTAEVSGDVAAASGTLTFGAGQLQDVITIDITGDEVAEVPETFRLVLGAATASDGRPVLTGEVPLAWIDDPFDTAPSADAGNDVQGIEGQAIAIAGTAFDDEDATTLWTVADAACTVAAPAALATTVTCPDDTVTTLTLTVHDGINTPATDTIALTVANAPPVIGAAAYQDGSLSVELTDMGSADSHLCEVSWGDGTPISILEPTGLSCILAHTYAPGVYTATVTVHDDDGGIAQISLEVRIGTPVGSWSQTGRLASDRILHTATRLPDGRVLVVGGYNASAELYDPATGTWSSTGNAPGSYRGATSVLLASGKVLVAGAASSGVSAALYNPATGTWAATGGLAQPRYWHAATLLADGRVLVMGGANQQGDGGTALASVEIYDPAAGTWTAAGSLNTARRRHTATLLPSGQVLVAGGENSAGRLTSAELYDPTSGLSTTVAFMSTARASHTATRLASGRVLVAGGGADGAPAARAEVYDPATQMWSATAAMSQPRRHHTATLVPSGKVLVTGGYDQTTGIHTGIEVYDPTLGTWQVLPAMAVERYQHTATLLADNRMLVAGGFSNVDQGSAELFAPLP